MLLLGFNGPPANNMTERVRLTMCDMSNIAKFAQLCTFYINIHILTTVQKSQIKYSSLRLEMYHLLNKLFCLLKKYLF